jgi:hypothetical protein
MGLTAKSPGRFFDDRQRQPGPGLRDGAERASQARVFAELKSSIRANMRTALSDLRRPGMRLSLEIKREWRGSPRWGRVMAANTESAGFFSK